MHGFALQKDAKWSVLTRGDTGLAASNVDSTTLLDMVGYDSVCFVASIVEVTAGASTTCVKLIPRMSTSNNTTGLSDMGSTSVAGDATVSTGDVQKLLISDVYRPIERYVSASIDKDGNGTSMVGPVIAIQYNSKRAPITQATGSVYSSKHSASPST